MDRRSSNRNLESEIEQRPLDPWLTEVATDEVLPPATRKPELLPFEQRSSEDFERICVAIAEQVDGLRDVRLYGDPGQRQKGIDLVGLDANGQAVVYQARRVITFTAHSLRKAVDDYVTEGRVFSAKRFVVCVASSARRTEIIDELVRQQQMRDFDVDLYDQVRLSDMLRNRRDLVRRFFGDAWERLFCGGETATASVRSHSDVLADAILRSPLEAFGLAENAAEAARLLDSEPHRAAELYESIAQELDESQFAGFADSYRIRLAECRRKAGDLREAVRLLSEVAWRGVEKGTSVRVHEASRELEGLSRESAAPTYAVMLAKILNAVDRWHADPYYNMDDLVSPVEQLVKDDAPGSSDAALWLAESAVVIEQYELVERIADTLEAIAEAREATSASDAMAVRLRACIADWTGDWETLHDRALRGRLGPKQATLIHARIGRYRAWNAEPEAADKSYRLAIGQACQAGITAEAAAALHSIWTLGIRYGLPTEDWLGATDLARDIQVAGTEYLRSAYDRRARGLADLCDDKLPSALENLRANLRLAKISGRLASEIDGHSLLGRLYQSAGESGLAARHHIRAGNAKVLEEWFSKVDTYVDCTDQLDRRAPWEQATALSALAAEGDLIPDDQVERLVGVALDRTCGQRQGLFEPWVGLSAYKLLASLAPRIPSSQVDPVVDVLKPFIDREPHQSFRNDEQHAGIVTDLFLAYPERRDRTGPHLLALMGANPDVGDKVLSVGWHAIKAGRDVLVEGLSRLANNGSKAALTALLHLKVDHPLLVNEARHLMELAINSPARKPGHHKIGSIMPHAAEFVQILQDEERVRFAEAAIRTAEDETEIGLNRAQAVDAVRIVARLLPDHVRSPLFDRAIVLAKAPTFSEIDKGRRGGLHRLSRFRLDAGAGLLVPQALRAAAVLALRKEQYHRVIELATSLFKANNELAANLAAHALSDLPRDEVEVDVRLLAASPVDAARQLAAVLWAYRPNDAPYLGQLLAIDSNSGVRRALAGSLTLLRERRADLAGHLSDLLSKDPSASVRAVVRGV